MLPKALLERLADGCEHSRARLSELLSLDAAELNAQLNSLASTGLEIVSPGPGALRLAAAIDWMDAATVVAGLSEPLRRRIESLELAFELESTNRRLLDAEPPSQSMARVAVAEFQSAGRGRRGRSWTMPPGTGVALSVSWRFDGRCSDLTALSLAVGAAARRAILHLTGLDIGLKWPNDLMVDDGKLGGVLVDLAQMSDGDIHAVVGIGINVNVSDAALAAASDFRHGARNLASAAPDWPIDRAALAAGLIEQVVELFSAYPADGFGPYRAEWLAAHVLSGRTIELRTDSGTATGKVVDVGDDGALIVQREGGEIQSVISGDVSVRARHDDRDRLR